MHVCVVLALPVHARQKVVHGPSGACEAGCMFRVMRSAKVVLAAWGPWHGLARLSAFRSEYAVHCVQATKAGVSVPAVEMGAKRGVCPSRAALSTLL